MDIVFICTGNICRSPMAQGFAAALGPDTGHLFRSAGTAALPGWPPTENALRVMAERGIDISDIRTTALSSVRSPDLVLCMTRGHVEWIETYRPDVLPVTEMLDLDGTDIADPYGQPIAVYRAVRDMIEEAVARRLVGWLDS